VHIRKKGKLRGFGVIGDSRGSENLLYRCLFLKRGGVQVEMIRGYTGGGKRTVELLTLLHISKKRGAKELAHRDFEKIRGKKHTDLGDKGKARRQRGRGHRLKVYAKTEKLCEGWGQMEGREGEIRATKTEPYQTEGIRRRKKRWMESGVGRYTKSPEGRGGKR